MYNWVFKSTCRRLYKLGFQREAERSTCLYKKKTNNKSLQHLAETRIHLSKCTILTENIETELQSDKENVHLFSQPISAHTTHMNTRGLAGRGLYATLPLILLLEVRVRDQNRWRLAGS